jgi:regulator of replication initiation timing
MFGLYKRLKEKIESLQGDIEYLESENNYIQGELTKEYQHNVELKAENEVLKERLAKYESPKELNTNTGERFIFFD